MRSCFLSCFVEFRSAVSEEKSKIWKVNDRRTGDGQCVITIVHFSDRLRCSDRSFICTYVHFFFFVEGIPLTLIHSGNAAKPSFPTSIVGIVFTWFGWVGQGSPKKEGAGSDRVLLRRRDLRHTSFYNGGISTGADLRFFSVVMKGKGRAFRENCETRPPPPPK